MDKLVLHAKEEEPAGRGTSIMRVSNNIAKQVRVLAHMTRQSDREITDTLIAFALARVELVPEQLYTLKMPSAEEPEE